MKANLKKALSALNARGTAGRLREELIKMYLPGSRRALLLCVSVMLALNITVLALPFSPSAAAEEEALTYTASDFSELKTAVEALGPIGDSGTPSPVTINITVTDSIYCSGKLRPADGNTVIINGNGNKISRATGFASDPLLEVTGSTSVIVDNATLAGGGISADKPLVFIAGEGASVTFRNGSKLYESRSGGSYGGIYIKGGVFDGGVTSADMASLDASKASVRSCDGAVYIEDGGTFRNCSIVNCGSANGAVFVENGSVVNCFIKDCTNDSASSCGGGIYMKDGTVSKCRIYGCANGNGGGIFMKKGSVSNCEIENCTAKTSGGGIYAQGGSISGVKIKNCRAGFCGGGIAVFRDRNVGNSGVVDLSGRLEIKDCGPTEDASSETFRGDSVYINDDKASGCASAPVASSAEIKIPDVFVRSVYTGTYDKNDLDKQPNIITCSALSDSASDKTVTALRNADTQAGIALGERVFGGVFSPDSNADITKPLTYSVMLTDGATHQASSGSAVSSGASSGTAESPYKLKRFMYVVYELSSDGSGSVTASIKHSGRLVANKFGDIVFDMTFTPTGAGSGSSAGTGDVSGEASAPGRGALAAVLYNYPNCCKIGSEEYPDLAKAIDSAHSGDTITLLRDTEVDETLLINKTNLTVDGDGHTVWRSTGFKDSLFNITSGTNFTLKNAEVSGYEFDSRFSEGSEVPPEVNAPLVTCAGILNLENTTLRDNNNTHASTGANDPRGGGVYLDGGHLNGDGKSSIVNNTACNGGGVFTKKPSESGAIPFKINGVDIRDNRATANGGGIFADDGLTLCDVTVQNNSASEKGGGVYAAKDANIGGTLQINNNTAGGNERSDYHLAIDNGKMTVVSPLSPASIIGVSNCADTSTVNGSKVNYNVLALADGSNVTSLKGLDKCFFVDSSSSSLRKTFENYPDDTKISCRSLNSATNRYTVTAGAEENGSISPSGEMQLPAGDHDFYITPDEGYVIDTVTVKPGTGSEVKLYSNDAPAAANANGSVKIEDGKGILTCNIQKDNTVINASFKKKAEGELKCETEKSGGNDKCTVSAEKAKVSMGDSDTITFSTGKDNLAYALTDIKVNGNSVKTDSSKPKMSDYADLKIKDDKSLEYTYKLNDIRSDKKVQGVFEEVYKKDSKTDSDSKITLSGDYIGTDAKLTVKKLPYTDKSYQAVSKELPADKSYKIRKASTAENDFALYDIELESQKLDYPYRSSVTLKLYAGTEYAGQDAYAYHVTDTEKGTVDKSLKGKVGNDGYFTVTTDSLSPYAVIVPSQASVTTAAPTTTTAAPASATPTTTAKAGSTTVPTNSTPHTGNRQPRVFWPIFLGSLVVAVISGTTIAMHFKKKRNAA